VLNQLKANITRSPSEALTTPYMTPGGKAMVYTYSLRIWLTRPKAKASFVTDDKGYRIGNTVKVKLEKSRFGSQGRQ
jgi:RecA/RadA recombinase